MKAATWCRRRTLLYLLVGSLIANLVSDVTCIHVLSLKITLLLLGFETWDETFDATNLPPICLFLFLCCVFYTEPCVHLTLQ